MSAAVFDRICQSPAVQALARRLERGGVLPHSGICPSSQPCLAVALRLLLPRRPIVVITEGLRAQEQWQQDAETWSRFLAPSASQPLFYPAWEVLPHQGKLPHADVLGERLQVLTTLILAPDETSIPLNQPGPVAGAIAPLIITTIVAMLQRTFPPAHLKTRLRRLRKGDRIDPLELIEWLEVECYEPVAKVTQKGELAVRGGILDVYPLTCPWPVRIEFFGDEVDSLREFDPHTQVSRDIISETALPPAGELGILSRTLSALAPGQLPENNLGSVLDYLPPDTCFLLCDAEALKSHAQAYAQQLPPHDPWHVTFDDFMRQLRQRNSPVLDMCEWETTGSAASLVAEPSILDGPTSESSALGVEPLLPLFTGLNAMRPQPNASPEPQVAEVQRREFFNQLHRWLRQDFTVWVFCNNEGERQRFNEIWSEYGLTAVPPQEATPPVPDLPLCGGQAATAAPVITLGTLSGGFLCETGKVAVVTDAEIFGRYKVQRARRLKTSHAIAARSAMEIDFTDLEEGDLVVHIQHGIGRYLGLSTMPAGSGRRRGMPVVMDGGTECLLIEYAPSAPDQAPPKLYVPVTEAHLVSKYIGAGRVHPPLNTLSGTRWHKARAQAEKAVRDLASELLTLQAARASQPGHAYSPDTPWQREFESAFLYEETPDQVRAIAETKGDMEIARPMDRLICGDVGFGKTEVALRAAFKGVMGGKQVAVLVPTTILAEQHFNTFRERMADYPIRVEVLSRFRSRREQRRILEDLATGGVDIVIGTHRLLQADVCVKDLGLVVIDEEQRFGVMHKEKLKQMRRLVDVLTLSATPIPRTLYQALIGARAMSTIETPPHDRLPVETVVTQYDERVIRDAIQRELNRQGQVFFLHNRVATIESMAVKLRAMVPQANILVGHGQMESDDLEKVMAQFINGEADVLLSTTIIESGLDIPNANTIIIDRADRFGLSDLYQLRGRVGRYKHQAYAYFLLPRHATLLADARKRLGAIKQYSRLGSGFKIAMRDLEIRGAGNLLGPEQSGHITAVGFELYCQLLKQSVARLKGESVQPRMSTQLGLDFLAFDPAEPLKAPVAESFAARPSKSGAKDTHIVVPREVATYFSEPAEDEAPSRAPARPAAAKAPAYIPLNYIADAQQRIEFYRKLAQVTDLAMLEQTRAEIQDRFGSLPPAVDLLLEATALKLLANERQVTRLETKDDKLMIQRHGDFLMFGGKFPRLTKKSAKARLSEIRRLLLSL